MRRLLGETERVGCPITAPDLDDDSQSAQGMTELRWAFDGKSFTLQRWVHSLHRWVDVPVVDVREDGPGATPS